MTLEELSSQLSTLIDITRQTLEEVRNLEKLLRNLVLDSEEHRCLIREELLSFFPQRQRFPKNAKLPPPETKS